MGKPFGQRRAEQDFSKETLKKLKNWGIRLYSTSTDLSGRILYGLDLDGAAAMKYHGEVLEIAETGVVFK